jgi:hypothetical protein
MLNYPEGKSSGEDLKHQGFWKILMLGILLQSAVAKNGVVKDIYTPLAIKHGTTWRF